MRLVLVRHGDAFAGFSGVIGGPLGCAGLTDLGRRQAEALRDHLAATGRVRADVLLASTIPRAVETAEIIAPGLGLEVHGRHPDLCEIGTGEADGLEWAEYANRYGTFDMEAEPDRVFAPEGESWNGFHARVGSMLARVAVEHADQTVVAVCHAGVVMASLRVLLGVPLTGSPTRIQPSNTGLTEWEHDPERDRWTLHGFNEAVHLLTLDRQATRLTRRLGAPPSGEGQEMADERFTVDSARRAAAEDDLDRWVAEFLASPGSDNVELGRLLADGRRWLGPVEVSIHELHRLAGPPGEPVLCAVDDDWWRDDVEDLAEKVEDGWEPPPLVVTYQDGRLVLEDGNHRVEGLRRAGDQEAWAVIGVLGDDDLEAVTARVARGH